MKMHKNIKNRIGQKIGRLTILSDTGQRKYGMVVWLCRCDCGNLTEVRSSCLTSGQTKSCGCFHRDSIIQRRKLQVGKNDPSFKHGDKFYGVAVPPYGSWISMIQRCTYSNHSAYHRYGGRGITICSEWRNDYRVFKRWALANNYKPGLSIDRINNDGNYEPSNCQWLTKSESSKKAWRDK